MTQLDFQVFLSVLKPSVETVAVGSLEGDRPSRCLGGCHRHRSVRIPPLFLLLLLLLLLLLRLFPRLLRCWAFRGAVGVAGTDRVLRGQGDVAQGGGQVPAGARTNKYIPARFFFCFFCFFSSRKVTKCVGCEFETTGGYSRLLRAASVAGAPRPSCRVTCLRAAPGFIGDALHLLEIGKHVIPSTGCTAMCVSGGT